MKIYIKINPEDVNIRHQLYLAIQGSRFKADIEGWDEKLKIADVRLRETKPYCGNHPNGCDVRGFGRQRRPARRDYLEGADWVEFNDLINDVLDTHNVSANVSTSVCIIRRGYERRVRYRSHPLVPLLWQKKGEDCDYENHCWAKDYPESEFPFGTPGIYRDKYRMEGHPA